MSLVYPNRYPDRYDPQSTSYPQGKFRNRSSVEAHDGGYFEQDLMNDWAGFFGALLKNGGVVPNGVVDTALNSQYYDAMVKALNVPTLTSTIDNSEDKAITPKAVNEVKKKADQVPNPILDQIPIGASGVAYKLITIADLKEAMNIETAKLYSTTGQATDGAMTQKATTDISFGIGQKWIDVSNQRVAGTNYTNTTSKAIMLCVGVETIGNTTSSSSIIVDGLLIARSTTRFSSDDKSSFVCAVIPPNSEYSFIHTTGIPISKIIAELRL